MSAAEKWDESDEGWEVDEVARARFEDPEFPEVLARKRAEAKGEVYVPEKHGPFDTKIVPRMARISETKPMIDVDAMLARFNARGRPVNDYLKAQANDR